MGLLGLRKFIDATGCTRLLPVPLSEEEALAQAEQLKSQQQQQQQQQQKPRGRALTPGDRGGRSYHAESRSGESDEPSIGSEDELDTEAAEDTAHPSGGAHASPGQPRVPLADHVLVDMNCILHSCFGRHDVSTASRKELIQLVLERLRLLLTQVVAPRKTLTFCLDGPAPYAKLQTQRLRRRKVALMDSSAQQLTSLAITAGSLFLVELENAIGAQFKLQGGKGFLRKRCPVYLYGSTVMGEGEAKIARALAFLASVGSTSTPAGAPTTASSPSTPAGGRVEQRGRGKGSVRSVSVPAASSSHVTTDGDGFTNLAPPYNPDDTVVVLGNDIDLVMTCLGATPFHNISVVGPSALQLISVSDILYRWMRASTTALGGAGGDSFRITPEILPSMRVDFIFLFLLNGGDHYVGAGEVAMTLWSRYRTVRASYPRSSLVSRQLDMLDTDFLVDLLDARNYSGEADPAPGLSLLQSALWSLYTTVTGICPDYTYTPPPSTPHLQNLRAAAASLKKGRQIKLHFRKDSQPLAPLEAYVALMPSEATLPPTIATALRAPSRVDEPSRLQLARTLATSNEPADVAEAAKAAVRAAQPTLSVSERYLCTFTPPVQLNAVPPRQRLSRYEQHRMLATRGSIVLEDPIPMVRRLPVTLFGSGFDRSTAPQGHTRAPELAAASSTTAAAAAAAGGSSGDYFTPPIPYTRWRYPLDTNALTFRFPFGARDAASTGARAVHGGDKGGGREGNGASEAGANTRAAGEESRGEPPRVLLSYALRKLTRSEAAAATKSTEVKLGYAVAEVTAMRRQKLEGRLPSEKPLRAALRRVARLQQQLERCRLAEADDEAGTFAVERKGRANRKRLRDEQAQDEGTGRADDTFADPGKSCAPKARARAAREHDGFLSDIQSFLGDDEDVAMVLGNYDAQGKGKAKKSKKAKKVAHAKSNGVHGSPATSKKKMGKGKKRVSALSKAVAANARGKAKAARKQESQNIRSKGSGKSGKKKKKNKK